MILLMDPSLTGCENQFYTLLHMYLPPGHKIYKEPRIKLFKDIKKPVLFHIIFYLEDDLKPVAFNGETLSFTCQLI